ncbi:unnamed protein product, partial [Adineta ricciae]
MTTIVSNHINQMRSDELNESYYECLNEAERYLAREQDADDDVPETESLEKQSPGTSTYNRPCSDFSMLTSSAASKQGISRSYQLARLQQALQAAQLLKTNADRIQFENEYLAAIRDNSFDRFARHYYKKIRDRYDRIKKDEETKRIRRFAFVDFEKNFMALYPTARDINIIFLDDQQPSTVTKSTNSRSASEHPKSALAVERDTEAIELFYADCSRRFLHNEARAKKEIEGFAHRAARNLAERIPAIKRPCQHVRIVDKRENIGKPNERTLLETTHKHAMSRILQRRQLVMKMMVQSKKNQFKMQGQWKRRPIGVDNPTCYREILERTIQCEEEYLDRPITRPQTAAVVSRTSPMKSLPLTTSTNLSQSRVDTAPTLESCLTPFQDSVTLFELENTKNLRVLLPTRPLTAPTKTDW